MPNAKCLINTPVPFVLTVLKILNALKILKTLKTLKTLNILIVLLNACATATAPLTPTP
jgi:hypothetical protein